MKNNKKIFNKNELKLNPFQYFVRHETTLKFQIGDKVFLKSNPEYPLNVYDIDLKYIHCVDDNGVIHNDFPPETLLHYKDAGLVVFNKEFMISLN